MGAGHNEELFKEAGIPTPNQLYTKGDGTMTILLRQQ
jgi:hypothetical protein